MKASRETVQIGGKSDAKVIARIRKWQRLCRRAFAKLPPVLRLADE